MKPFKYKGYRVTPVFFYNDGTIDFEFYKISDPEVGGVVSGGSVRDVKLSIDSRI